VARIVISSLGTTGDFVPFVPLAKLLKERGHSVLVAVNEAMHDLFRHAGLDVVRCGPRFGPEEGRRNALAFDGWAPYTEERQRLDADINDVPGNYRDLLAACRGADLLIAVSIQYAAPLVARDLHLPWVCVFCNAERLQHEPEGGSDRSLPTADLVLLASSRQFSQPRKDLYPQLWVTGFWFYDGADQPGWSGPSPELKAFVESGDPPLVLLPGSIPTAEAQAMVAVHAEAAARLHRRLVIQTGWANLGPRHLPTSVNGQEIWFADHLPHDWLLERSGAVICHATMGILAKALRAGCPVLAEPYGRDLFFNARRILALGVGAAMNPHQLTVEGVARVLNERVLTAPVKAQAVSLAIQLRAENGVGLACDCIESLIAK
jgi:UDP:flavonoid glycosyltransferase YjiC (YdhE family)